MIVEILLGGAVVLAAFAAGSLVGAKIGIAAYIKDVESELEKVFGKKTSTGVANPTKPPAPPASTGSTS